MKIHPVIRNDEKNLSICIQHYIHRYKTLIESTDIYHYQFINNRNRFGFMISKSIIK